MEVNLSPETEARLGDATQRTGKEAAVLIEEAVNRMLEYDAHFLEAVGHGRAAARRGELLEHNEVVERVNRILRS